MGRIVVGVDGSDSSIKALHWAVRQAELTGATVEAVNSWEYPATSWASMMPGMPEDFDPQALATVSLNEALEEALGAGGAAGVSKVVVIGNPAQALLDRAQGADLLVVGARGHTGLKATLLGSVSLHVTQHAPCPVTVVRD
ncbi:MULTISPECIES: universal stress protein [Streptomyces]|uniref:UspA domain-containing protein n=1 Tax=Streptomyces griseus subsp. griseus (strain JCM 4626 / CBS 651.72 / NBRC 13350 / KCC S-0626 / ISP 5235) TaxID=455632 RepID=B1VQY4_STRGG|nr:universal stress protein [Streptomyces griseus]MYR10258.1 universal stress protein [Streptomyces sp. SID724]MBW3706285.1 universal stress protein [Streptomyces griseus]NEB51267.1 universal stress protein [Streptomyces griseus]SEE76808.1 Nucleotide-binding universal stress protein, UspA family [Streptomyces griseus]SQA20413.1 UspA domain protein [Streptomyces griseus]